MANEPITKQTERKQPVHQIRIGPLKAAIWENKIDLGTIHNVTFERSYRDGEEWRASNSFGKGDLLALAKLADQAHTWIVSTETKTKANRVGEGNKDVNLSKGRLPKRG